MIDVLVVGGGAREHALLWSFHKSAQFGKLYCAPGNGGTAALAENVPIAVMDIPGLIDFVQEKKIGLTVVGPDNPLAAGIVDKFRAKGLAIFGPTKQAARLEWSKAYAKSFMALHGIPTAQFKIFDQAAAAVDYVREKGAPVVVKASGLALGKGVFVCKSLAEAEEAVRQIMIERRFKDAGDQAVIEEFLEGQELSIHAITDGGEGCGRVLLAAVKDYKRLLDDDRGPNTGGMGSVLGSTACAWELRKRLDESVILPMLRGLRGQGTPFAGCLYPGIMLTKDGPKVLEFNARLGDPETQVLARVHGGGLARLVAGAAVGRLPDSFGGDPHEAAVCVVLASKGYPDRPETGHEITGIDLAAKVPGVEIFHAGTALRHGKLVTSGGRVLSVTATGYLLQEARLRAYQAAQLIRFEGVHFRRDIGLNIVFPE